MSVPRKRINNYIAVKPKVKKKESRGGCKWHHSTWWRSRSKYIRMIRPICEDCEEVEMTNRSEEVDHIEPIPPGATFEQFKKMSHEDNLRALCKGHHASKSGKEANEWKRLK